MIPSKSEDGEVQTITKIIEGLLVCVSEETAALNDRARFDLPASNARKSRLLYELNRAAGGLGATDISPRLRTELKALRAELAANALLVKGHAGAVREISDMMINMVRKNETDGTYMKPRSGYAAW